jgi:Yip1 domain
MRRLEEWSHSAFALFGLGARTEPGLQTLWHFIFYATGRGLHCATNMVCCRLERPIKRGKPMSLINRVKNILLAPNSEWDVIAKEPATVGGLITSYAIPLMILPIIGNILAVGVLGIGANSMAALGVASLGVGAAAAMGIVGFALQLVLLFAMIFAVNAISPSFNGKSDSAAAAKVMVYSSTPSWIAGLIVPFLGMIGGLLSIGAIAYVVYLIYSAIRPIMEAPQEKVAGFTVVIILIYIVLSIVLTMVIGGVLIAALLGGGMMAGAAA